jgi:hypothetical protein
MDEVAVAVERTCRQQYGSTPQQMAAALIAALFEVKMENPKASVALLLGQL